MDISQVDADAIQQFTDALAKEVARYTRASKEWMSLKRAAAEYADLSERTLRSYLGHPVNPLPARLCGGKWLISRSDMDAWIRSFPAQGRLDQLVDDVLADFKGEKDGG